MTKKRRQKSTVLYKADTFLGPKLYCFKGNLGLKEGKYQNLEINLISPCKWQVSNSHSLIQCLMVKMYFRGRNNGQESRTIREVAKISLGDWLTYLKHFQNLELFIDKSYLVTTGLHLDSVLLISTSYFIFKGSRCFFNVLLCRDFLCAVAWQQSKLVLERVQFLIYSQDIPHCTGQFYTR